MELAYIMVLKTMARRRLWVRLPPCPLQITKIKGVKYMKYFSEVTKKIYDTEKELEEAEKAVENEKLIYEADVKKLNEAYEALKAAEKAYDAATKEFNEKHRKIVKKKININPNKEYTFEDILDIIFGE